jgi:hypothetical protein
MKKLGRQFAQQVWGAWQTVELIGYDRVTLRAEPQAR